MTDQRPPSLSPRAIEGVEQLIAEAEKLLADIEPASWAPDHDWRDDGADQVIDSATDFTVCFIATGMDTVLHQCLTEFIAAAPRLVRKLLAALAASEATQEGVDPRWKDVACLFHDALVGANNAGMYNQQLATEAVRLLDAVMAHEGSGRADDNAPLLARIAQCSCGLFSEDRYEPLAASEARERPVKAHVSELRSGEENDGPLKSVDLYLKARGISLLVNADVEGDVTYNLIVDGQPTQDGYVIRAEARERPQPAQEDNGTDRTMCAAEEWQRDGHGGWAVRRCEHRQSLHPDGCHWFGRWMYSALPPSPLPAQEKRSNEE